MKCEITDKHVYCINLDEQFISEAIKEKILKDKGIEIHVNCPIFYRFDSMNTLTGANIEFVRRENM